MICAHSPSPRSHSLFGEWGGQESCTHRGDPAGTCPPHKAGVIALCTSVISSLVQASSGSLGELRGSQDLARLPGTVLDLKSISSAWQGPTPGGGGTHLSCSVCQLRAEHRLVLALERQCGEKAELSQRSRILSQLCHFMV